MLILKSYKQISNSIWNTQWNERVLIVDIILTKSYSDILFLYNKLINNNTMDSSFDPQAETP